ncbi:hypothetical protein HOY82DRAFT_605807 [Tuber indicum]|nr:hypothetical protein HOY82DRAFT_605807 [Tuber indicum]
MAPSTIIPEKTPDCSYDRVVTYVYCDFRAQNELSVSSILGSVLSQIPERQQPLLGQVLGALFYAQESSGDYRLQLREIFEKLFYSIYGWNRFFICIDAIDEFPTEKRAQLWESLQRIVRECRNVRLFLTGRPQIREEARKYFPGNANMVSVKPNTDDITSYIEHRLGEDLAPGGVSVELRADILRIVPQKLSGMFLLVALKIDAILGEMTIHKRRQVLGEMSNGLDLSNAYEQTLNRIRQQGGGKGKLGIEALMWISRCERPLNSEELCYALGVELGEEDLNAQNVPLIQTILGCTLGLVKIDETASTVCLLHPTLQEYLGQHPTLFATAHSMMAEICLTYLNYRSIRELPPCLYTGPITTPFLEYATCFWGSHAAVEVTEKVKNLALQLLDGYENHVSASILWQKKIRKWYLPREIMGITGLHCIAFWGIAEIASAMLEAKRWDTDCGDSGGDTPLMWTVKYGNDRLAKILLDQGDTEPEVVLSASHAISSPTAQWRNEGVVKLLLQRGNVNPNSRDRNRRTPLSYAAMGGLGSVVRVLLERGDVDPDPSDSNGRTPLSFAAEWGREDLVKPFLERGNVNPNLPDNKGRSPLSLVAGYRYERVLKLFSEYGNPNRGLPEASGRATTAAPGQDTQGQEATDPLQVPGGVSPHEKDGLQLDASNPPSTMCGPPQKQPLACKLPSLDQPDSNSSLSTPIRTFNFSLALNLFLLALVIWFILHGSEDYLGPAARKQASESNNEKVWADVAKISATAGTRRPKKVHSRQAWPYHQGLKGPKAPPASLGQQRLMAELKGRDKQHMDKLLVKLIKDLRNH